jgi:uncharacterized protein YndB with AHSA1/START domain
MAGTSFTETDTVADREIVTTRVFPFSREVVFNSWSDPAQLALWWGPQGFTNTFQVFEFRSDGDWRFIMHGPDGAEYPNHSVFRVIRAPERIVFDHLSTHWFRVIADFEAVGPDQTRLTFRMQFETVAECERVKVFAVECNEQNFDRLASLLAANSTGSSA